MRLVSLAALCLCSCMSVFSASTETLARVGLAPPPEEKPSLLGKGAGYEVTTKTLGTLLGTLPVRNSHLEGFYEVVPATLEQAVRWISEENYTSASILLSQRLQEALNPREKARVLMWLGICAGQEALDNGVVARERGTSASLYLQQAIRLDPKVYEASDVARILAEMAVQKWGPRNSAFPYTLEGAEVKADTSGKAVDNYYAAIMLRRQSAILWAQGDTTMLDQRAILQLQQAVEKDPEKYEYWTQYLPAMMPLGMHPHMNAESEKMYDHFKALRTPMIADLGPASLYLRTRGGYTMADDDRFLNDLMKNRSREPFGHFQMALWAIETTPTLAVNLFTEFLRKLDAGEIDLEPREAGYRPSALYKLAFLSDQEAGLTTSLELYRKVKAISPTYAEVNANLGVISLRIAEKETTGPRKLQLIRDAIDYANVQSNYDYRGKSSTKIEKMIEYAKGLADAVEKDMKKAGL